MQHTNDDESASGREMAHADVANGEGDPNRPDAITDDESSDLGQRSSDPDAPGTFVNNDSADQVPEPNEPA